MKKAVVKTALAVLPKSIQYKALCKALNYLLPYADCPFESGTVLKLNVFDLKKVWLIECGSTHYAKSSMPIEDVELRASFDTLIECKEQSYIKASLNNGDILVLGNPAYCQKVTSELLRIPQEKLSNLLNYFTRFLKLKKNDKVANSASEEVKPVDIQLLKLADIKQHNLKTDFDINYVREQALMLEHSNLNEACRLMELAHLARPEGPYIKQKLESFKVKLKHK